MYIVQPITFYKTVKLFHIQLHDHYNKPSKTREDIPVLHVNTLSESVCVTELGLHTGRLEYKISSLDYHAYFTKVGFVTFYLWHNKVFPKSIWVKTFFVYVYILKFL